MEGGLGWHPDRGELARKLKRAARRPGVPVADRGEAPGFSRADGCGCRWRARTRASARAPAVAPAAPATLAPMRPRAGASAPRGSGAAPGTPLHVLAAGRGWTAARAAPWRPSLVPAVCTVSGWTAPGGLREAAASTWRAVRGPGDGTCPERRAPPRCGPAGPGRALRAPLPSAVPAECLRRWAMGSGAQRRADSSLPGPRFPVKLEETHFAVAQAAEREETEGAASTLSLWPQAPRLGLS